MTEDVAFTRASTLGPLLDLVEAGGGSVERIFQRAEMPLRLCDHPEILIPLRDQFKIVEYAADELGDDILPTRLSLSAGIAGLGKYGDIFLAAPTVRAAIERGNKIYSSVLQSGTVMTLTIKGKTALWTYQVTDRAEIGRQKNEILAIGYMVELLRWFLGSRWAPDHVDLPGSRPSGKISIEALYRCELSNGNLVTMYFPAEMLEIPNPLPRPRAEPDELNHLPVPNDFSACVNELVRLGLLKNRPQRDWVARHLGLSVRSMQRHLNQAGTTYSRIMQGVMAQRARELLGFQDMSILEIAYELGYSDPSHFSRAFAQWHSQSPRSWRARNTLAQSAPF